MPPPRFLHRSAVVEAMGTRVEFCGEIYALDPQRPFVVGRDADLVIDDNPFLHRRFLQIGYLYDLWWLGNIGSHLSATVSDDAGLMQAWLAPGASLPIVFGEISVWFTAGPTTYEFVVSTDAPPFTTVAVEGEVSGNTTTGRLALQPEQRMLLLALAEPLLRSKPSGLASIPPSAAVAKRLGWTITKFNRKLDALCERLEESGVAGLHGGSDRLAANRRARLVEYALATRLVQREDLDILAYPSDPTLPIPGGVVPK